MNEQLTVTTGGTPNPTVANTKLLKAILHCLVTTKEPTLTKTAIMDFVRGYLGRRVSRHEIKRKLDQLAYAGVVMSVHTPTTSTYQLQDGMP